MRRRVVVVGDPLGRAGGHGDVVGQAGVRLGVEACGEAALVCQAVDVGGVGRADDLRIGLVLHDDPDHMLVGRWRRVRGPTRTRRVRGRRGGWRQRAAGGAAAGGAAAAAAAAGGGGGAAAGGGRGGGGGGGGGGGVRRGVGARCRQRLHHQLGGGRTGLAAGVPAGRGAVGCQ